MSTPLVVLDTMVIVAGITGRPDGASAMCLRAVATGEVRLAISDDSLSELVRVVGYPDIEKQIGRPVRAFEVAMDIGTMGYMHYPRRLDWPSLTDPNDGWVLDLAYESGADYIVTFDEGIRQHATDLGFEVIFPGDLLQVIREQYS